MKDPGRRTRGYAAALIGALWLAAAVPAAAGFAGPDTCSACHPDEHQAWKGSLHARALNDRFKAVWKERGSRPECLTCHTTGHAKGSLSYAHPGVSCESCHGAMADGHPGDKMPLPVSSDMCASCHRKTHQEWKISRHGQKDIRCFDCHNAHGQGLRAGGGDALCGSCHPGRLKDFAHATHRREGLTCATCHMPHFAEDREAVAGTNTPGHSLSVGVEVCSRCHEETVHKSGHLTDLKSELGETKKQLALTGVEDAFEMKEQVRDLSWRLERARQSAWLTAVLGLLAGLGLGWLGAWYLLRRRSGR
jgi:hypothetical protein